MFAEFLPRRDVLPHPEPGAAAAGEAGGQHCGGRGAVPAGQINMIVTHRRELFNFYNHPCQNPLSFNCVPLHCADGQRGVRARLHRAAGSQLHFLL